MPTSALRLQLVQRPPDGLSEEVRRVAFATSDLRHVDQHFGATLGMAIYEIHRLGSRLVEAARFQPAARDGLDDKLRPRLDSVAACCLVFCNAVGGSALRQLLLRGVRPVRVDPGTAIGGLVNDLGAAMAQGREFNPYAFLERRVRPRDAGRMQALLTETWEE
ncbi:MAG: nitrogen fixation protein NifX [Magnetococcales bacterium]|nr:nitrogen fixation protein NifX [Magnetococcales bacterium]